MLSAAVLLLQTENIVCVPTLKCVSVSTISRYLGYQGVVLQVDQAEVGHGAAHHPAGAHLRVHAGRGPRLPLSLRAVQVGDHHGGDGLDRSSYDDDGEGNDDSVQGGPGLLLHGARAGLVHV